MLQPIKLQQLLIESLKQTQPTISGLFVCTLDGQALAFANAAQNQLKDQALQASLSILFDDCKEIGRLKLTNNEEATLNYAFFEHDDGIVTIANIQNLFLLGAISGQKQKIGIIIKYLEKVKRALESMIGEEK